MKTLSVSYSIWKQVVQADSMQVYFLPEQDGEMGTVWAGTDAFVYTSRIVSDTWEDFNTNFPSQDRIEVGRADDAVAQIVSGLADIPSERSTDGGLLTSSTHPMFENDEGFKGVLLDAPYGQTSFYDLLITTQVRVAGAEYWSVNVNNGDYVEFSVVDKDDVLGLFSQYGYTVGEDVLELGKWVATKYLKPGDTQPTAVTVKDEAPVTAGLYLRLKYENVGTSGEATVGVDYDFFYEE